MSGKCRCDSKPCAGGCPCSKAGQVCGGACHGGKVKEMFHCIFVRHYVQPWDSVPCLNTEAGARVKGLKPVEVRSALCDAGLSPIGDKNELLKRLAVHYAALSGTALHVGVSRGGVVKVPGSRSQQCILWWLFIVT